jgi:carbamoyl-phosphate synthase small subunit
VAVTKPALLALEDGTVFRGLSVGAEGKSVGEVVFNTAITGYQEILTDPSYCRQLITLTYPHIGNTGTTDEDDESDQVYAAGLIVRDVPRTLSNWRSKESLQAFLVRHGVVAMADIDTRKLTRIIRDKGAQAGCLIAAGEKSDGNEIDTATIEAALDSARAFPGLAGMDLARVVSTTQPYDWHESTWTHAQNHQGFARPEALYRVVAYDFGIKRNILRLLVKHGCELTVVPATTSAEEVLALQPDGIFLSNGPGDPEPCDYAIEATRRFLAMKIPLFGICLGHQILGLAAGAKTIKMKFGHHGANHPVQDLQSGRVMISSQNHGFAVDEATLPDAVRTTHRSLFDGSLQGIEFTDRPAFSFQGHPEASPGPHDLESLFERFVALMAGARPSKEKEITTDMKQTVTL